MVPVRGREARTHPTTRPRFASPAPPETDRAFPPRCRVHSGCFRSRARSGPAPPATGVALRRHAARLRVRAVAPVQRRTRPRGPPSRIGDYPARTWRSRGPHAARPRPARRRRRRGTQRQQHAGGPWPLLSIVASMRTRERRRGSATGGAGGFNPAAPGVETVGVGAGGRTMARTSAAGRRKSVLANPGQRTYDTGPYSPTL
jgi:hypothetical protein